MDRARSPPSRIWFAVTRFAASDGCAEVAYSRASASAKRAGVHFLSRQPITGAETLDLVLDGSLLLLETSDLGVPAGDASQVVGDHRADGAAALRRPNMRSAVDLIRHRNRDLLHGEGPHPTISQ